MVTRLIAYLRGLAHRRRIDDEISEELQDHVEREVQRHVAHGRASRRGAPAGTPGPRWTDANDRSGPRCSRDLARRRLARHPIRGAGPQTLATVHDHRADAARPGHRLDDGHLLDRVCRAGASAAVSGPRSAGVPRGKGAAGVAWPNFEDWRQRATSFDGLASSLADAVIVTSGQVPRRFESRSVTSNFFRVLGVSAFRGRLFDDSDARPDAAATVVVSHALLDARARRRRCGDRPDDIAQPQPVHRDRRAAAGLPLHDAGGRVPPARATGRGELSRHAVPQHAHDALRRRPAETGRQRRRGANGDAGDRGRARPGVSGHQHGQRRAPRPARRPHRREHGADADGARRRRRRCFC